MADFDRNCPMSDRYFRICISPSIHLPTFLFVSLAACLPACQPNHLYTSMPALPYVSLLVHLAVISSISLPPCLSKYCLPLFAQLAMISSICLPPCLSKYCLHSVENTNVTNHVYVNPCVLIMLHLPLHIASQLSDVNKLVQLQWIRHHSDLQQRMQRFSNRKNHKGNSHQNQCSLHVQKAQ